MSGTRIRRLVGGFPKEPGHGNWDELSSLPGPPRLMETLFLEILNVDVGKDACHEVGSPEQEDATGEVMIHRYFCGRDGVGYEWTERVVLESSDFPVGVTITSAGLPGIDLLWRFDLAYEGQLGHCGFRHGDLVVTFADAGIEGRFAKFWEQVFGLRPVFVPT